MSPPEEIDYMNYKVWDEITYLFLTFSGATNEVWEWISNFILHLLGKWLINHGGIKVNPC